MKYFKERRRARRAPKDSTVPSNLSEGFSDGKVGADLSPASQFQVNFQEQTIDKSITESISHEKERDKHRERLTFARRRRDIRLTRKEVSCLQVLVQTVLSEHLALSRELNAANERIGLPSDPLPLNAVPRKGEHQQFALERDAARLKEALLDRGERLEGAAADAASLRQKLEKWRRESAIEAEKQRAALENVLSEKAKALEMAVEKDEIISNLRSELALLESKRSNEALSMSRALTEREVYIKELEGQAQDTAAEMGITQMEFKENVALLEMERTARCSTEHALEMVRADLKKVREDHEATAIMLSEVLSAKEAEMEDLKKMMEETKQHYVEDMTAAKRAADEDIAKAKYDGEKVLAQKMVEMHTLQGTLKKAQSEVEKLHSKLNSEGNKISVLHGELAAARNEIVDREKSAASRIAELNAELAQQQARHNEEMQNRAAIFEEQLKSVRSEAAAVRTNLENIFSQLQKEATEKSGLERQLADIKEKLADTKTVAQRVPSLESQLKKAHEEINFLNEKSAERNAELAARKKEAGEYLEEVKRTKREMDIDRSKNEEEIKRLKEEIESLKMKKEDEARHFRNALHERDLGIRERQDLLDKFAIDQAAIQQSLATAQEALEDAAIKYKKSLASARSSYRENTAQLKTQISKKNEEIEALHETVKGLHSKISDQFKQYSQEVDRLRASSEKTKNSLEKKLKEKEALLNASEDEKAKLQEKLSTALKNKEMIMKELEQVRGELKRTMGFLWDARGETNLALDALIDTETAMTSVYADSVMGKISLNDTKSKMEELNELWHKATKEIDQRKNKYDILKVRFIKYVKSREDEMKAAGDSVEQNRAEAQKYLNELKTSKTKLESSEELCHVFKKDLELALQKIESLSANENALLAQAEQNKHLLSLAETELETLKSDLNLPKSDLEKLNNELRERVSELNVIVNDLEKSLKTERNVSARLVVDCQEAFSIIENAFRERGWVLNRGNVKLSEGVNFLLENIRHLESELHEVCKQFNHVRDEHESLKKGLSCLKLESEERSLMSNREDLVIEELPLELNELREEMSRQQSKIAVLEKSLTDIESQARVSFEEADTLKKDLEEEQYLLHDANSRIEQLTSQLDHERSRVAELERELSKAVDTFQPESNEKTVNCEDISKRLVKLKSDLFSNLNNLQNPEVISPQDRHNEVSCLLSLLELAHQECECKSPHESADGDGNKETISDGSKELKIALAQRDTDVAKLRSVIGDLQGELSMNKSVSDREIASYRYNVEKLSKEITALKQQLEEREADTGLSEKLELHSTTEQTRLSGRQGQSPRRRPGAPGAPGGALLVRTVSEGNGAGLARENGSLEIPMADLDEAQ